MITRLCVCLCVRVLFANAIQLVSGLQHVSVGQDCRIRSVMVVAVVVVRVVLSLVLLDLAGMCKVQAV